MKKTLPILVLLISFCLLLAGCASDALPSDLYVVAENKTDVPAGAYTLEYSIHKYEAYRGKYSLSVSVNVYDEDNIVVPVQNNRTMVVERDKTYTAVISVYGVVDGKQAVISGQYVFSAAKSPRMVTLLHETGEIITQFEVLYGTDLPLEALPDVPVVYPARNDGVSYTEIVSKKWMVLSGASSSEYVDLTQAYLTNLTTDKQIFAVYEYKTSAIPYTMYFEENGGSEVPDFVGDSQTTPAIQPAPVREGYVFLGWCKNAACTEFYDWLQTGALSSDVTLYAKWAKIVEAPTRDALFIFEKKTDDYGNEYYALAARDAANLTGDIVIPNEHDGLPVRRLAEKAFERAQITSVFIPNTIVLDRQRVFADCEQLSSVVFEDGYEGNLIPTRCFSQCVSLPAFTMPDSVQIVQPNAFANCLSLATIRLSERLVFITADAFRGCSSLRDVSLPDTAESILTGAFAGCTSLQTFLVPERTRLHIVEEGAFEQSSLESVILPERLRQYDLDFGDATVLYQ